MKLLSAFSLFCALSRATAFVELDWCGSTKDKHGSVLLVVNEGTVEKAKDPTISTIDVLAYRSAKFSNVIITSDPQAVLDDLEVTNGIWEFKTTKFNFLHNEKFLSLAYIGSTSLEIYCSIKSSFDILVEGNPWNPKQCTSSSAKNGKTGILQGFLKKLTQGPVKHERSFSLGRTRPSSPIKTNSTEERSIKSAQNSPTEGKKGNYFARRKSIIRNPVVLADEKNLSFEGHVDNDSIRAPLTDPRKPIKPLYSGDDSKHFVGLGDASNVYGDGSHLSYPVQLHLRPVVLNEVETREENGQRKSLTYRYSTFVVDASFHADEVAPPRRKQREKLFFKLSLNGDNIFYTPEQLERQPTMAEYFNFALDHVIDRKSFNHGMKPCEGKEGYYAPLPDGNNPETPIEEYNVEDLVPVLQQKPTISTNWSELSPPIQQETPGSEATPGNTPDKNNIRVVNAKKRRNNGYNMTPRGYAIPLNVGDKGSPVKVN